jgi:hypothetical protein
MHRHRRALALTDRQLAFVRRGAAMLPVHRRDAFLWRVAAQSVDTPADGAVIEAVNNALDGAAAILCEKEEAAA